MEALLHRLEKKIKDLIDQHDKLKNTQQQLHQGKALLVREKEAILTKQQKAIIQIEALVARLKTIEKSS